MTANCHIALTNGNETLIYRVAENANSELYVASSKMHESFIPIKVNGPSPSKRTKFSLAALNNTAFIMTGGDGTGITSTEVWAFDIVNSRWIQLTTSQDPIKRRSGHCSSCAGNIIYVFGGSNGLDISNELLVITINGSTFTYSEIESQSDWPCPRSQHTMTQMKNTIYIFGGTQDDGNVLNDLWELDYSLFPQSPSWHLVEKKRAPAGRHSHVAWKDTNGDFCIAGGLAMDDAPYNEIWKFHGQLWEETKIIDCHYILFACQQFGLLEIGQTINEATLLPPFAALDGLFERLKFKQSEYSNNLTWQSRRMSYANKSSQTLKKFESIIDQQKTSEYPQIMGYFSESEVQNKLNLISQSRSILTNTAANIVKNYPRFLQHQCRNPNAEELASQLLLKLQECQSTLQKAKEERNKEKELYEKHLEMLKGNLPEFQIQQQPQQQQINQTKIPNIDPADFSTFLQYKLTLPQDNLVIQEVALKNYYRMQLREYQRLKQQTQLVQQKLKKASESQSKRNETVSRLSEELTKKFKSVTKAEEELKMWNKWLVEAKEDTGKVNAFINAVMEYQKSRQNLENKIAVFEKEVQSLQATLKKDLTDLEINKKNHIERLIQTLNGLKSAGRPDQIQNSIDVEYPNIQKFKEAILQ